MNKSIKSKFLFFSLTIFVVMFTAVGSHNYFKAEGEIITRMDKQIDMAKLRASTVLPSLIWNFATDSITDFSKAELRSEFVSGFIVSDGNEALFSGIKSLDDSIVLSNLDKFEEADKHVKFELIHIENNDQNTVGHVMIRANVEYLHNQLNQVLIQQVMQSVAYCFVLFILIWALINKLVLVPLLQLNKRLKNITFEISQR